MMTVAGVISRNVIHSDSIKLPDGPRTETPSPPYLQPHHPSLLSIESKRRVSSLKSRVSSRKSEYRV